MKINLSNTDRIEDALLKANGAAREYTFTTAEELRALAAEAERKLGALLTRYDLHRGARYCATSGAPVAKSYRKDRIATRVTLERGTEDWFLVDVTRVQLYPDQGGGRLLTLTPEQDQNAVERLRKSYVVGEQA